MSETMRPVSFAQLMNRALTEYAQTGAIFGVHALYHHTLQKSLPIFHERVETPFGPAAGPHTQLAQNLVAAYAGGARFFEVKTVQQMDGAQMAACIARPCILAEDEGYNVEWSTELTVAQAHAEYVKAYFAMKLLSRELDFGDPNGFVINMSVGYDLEGIQSPKIDAYIEGMRNAQASDVWVECQTWALANLSRFEKIDAAFVEAISPKVCDSITLSTLHGCPPEEIERIAVYLLDNKKLNTYIKCNPTLLGYEFARSTMDEMGYDELQFDDHHFRDDLQYADAVPMIRRLLALAKEKGVEFGVKLTNTFPVEIAHGELPGQEMYMSGRSLYPLSIALAAKLEKDFAGRLRVSYSGGADACNITALFGCGIWPITMATTLLKPGGYNRLCQMANALAAMPYAPFSGVDTKRLSQLAQDARSDVRYRRPAKHGKNRKLASKAPLLDCFVASCQENCPIHQDIPAYLQLVAEGRYEQALAVICEKNPLPFITGTICNHRCQAACTRNFYEEAVHIRDAKLTAAQNGFDGYLKTVRPAKRKDALSVAVVGGGPGGMAAAFLAARAGARVVLFERSESLGGVVKHVIPEFRIPASAIAQDARLLAAMGVDIRLNAPVLCADELAGYDHVIVAVGAGKHLGLKLTEGQALNAIDFLTSAKSKPSAVAVQGKVIVVGGGNTAMDAARAATRLPGVTGVSIVYRRQMRQMPADLEELELAMSEGVALRELLSPISHRNGALLCDIMRLGAPGADGRQSPECTGETVEIPADYVIAAIGEKPDEEAIAAFGDRVTVIGDAKRGPATVVEAIADATAAVERLLAVHPASVRIASGALQAKRGVLRPCDGSCDAQRCLGCDLLCENCVDVCPNRANAVVMIDGRAQVLHIDRLCNECGNCAAFCPYGGEPYHDKLTLFSNVEDFERSPNNQGFLPLGEQRLRIRLNGETFETELPDARVPKQTEAFVRAVLDTYAYLM